MTSSKRPVFSIDNIHNAISAIADKVRFRLDQKGFGVMMSSHEILGWIEEERHEFLIEVHANGTVDRKVEELIDLAVVCIIGIASLQSGKAEW